MTMHNDGTGPRYDRPARRRIPIDAQPVATGDQEAPPAGNDAEPTPTTPDAQKAPQDAGYEPGDHTVAEVQEYLSENPDQTEYVRERERSGKSRVTLLTEEA